MAITPTEARSESTGLDLDYLLLIIGMESDIDELASITSKQMSDAVTAAGPTQPIQDADTVTANLIAILALFYAALAAIYIATLFKLAGIRVKHDTIEYLQPLIRVRAMKEAAKLRIQLRSYPQDIRKSGETFKHGPDNRNYRQRIKSLQEGSERTVRNIIENGVREGKSAQDIAKKIEAYVKPNPNARTMPYDEYRKRFNRPKSYKPPKTPAGSIKTNALMIARTEIAELQREFTSRRYKDKSWIRGFRWVLSRSHPAKDVCDLHAAKRYSKTDIRPFSHPHCICDWIAERFTDAELERMVKSGILA